MSSAGTLPFTSTHGMIDRVHGHTANMGPLAQPAVPARLTKFLAAMLRIADLTNAGTAQLVESAHLSRGQLDQNMITFFGHELGRRTGTANQLRPLADFHLHVVNNGTKWNIGHGQTVTGFDIDSFTGRNLIAYR